MITILMYHQVGTFGRVDAHRAVYCDAGAFRRQMAFLKAGRYNVLSLDEVYACVTGAKEIPSRAVHLSFDDGYADFAAIAHPAIRRRGFPSSVYMVSGLMDSEAAWLPSEGLRSARLMSADALRRVDSEGARVGCHTASHRRLSGLDPIDLQREIVGSREALEEALNRPVVDFCYPYGDLDRAAVEAVRAAGYRLALTCERNRAGRGTDPLLIPRHAVSYGTSLVGLWWKLHLQKPGKPLSI
ncbi:MAG TPA: polysaccharide deacetylase family protein [Armatimonadota bacterium]|jgi:peptidoglycan/xylan/chitin deacetylase (PgdA/CDA1 family)